MVICGSISVTISLPLILGIISITTLIIEIIVNKNTIKYQVTKWTESDNLKILQILLLLFVSLNIFLITNLIFK